ncbi:hypothetical protein OS493_034140 [Desmophyllum pertusum]|uniref:Uncharacterized protein n=1 Tax=Desmophyllum pertusum TaxID=174260 RepID=A0A9W9Y800_9CNID|nr:hypothetical protein OS493_034140 [Desmophyllum pertusum]
MAASVKESFECPRCYGKGSSVADARKQCDENMKYEDCKWIGNKDLICATEIYSDQYESTVERSCEKKEYYDSRELECFNSRDEKCGMAMCNTTRCKAVVNMPVERCSSCDSDTSLEDCDANAVMEECWRPSQARCYVGKVTSRKNPDQYLYRRGCATEELYQRLTSVCGDEANKCQVGFCRESDCLASLGN